MKIRDMAYVAVFTAVLAVVSQISIMSPGGVPITIQVFAVALAGAVLGWKLGVISMVVYILIGIVGAPVFAGMQAGLGVIVGPAGGYVLMWPVMAGLCGINVKHDSKKLQLLISVVLALVGLAVVEIVGGIQWSLLSESMSLKAIMVYSLAAFVPKDIIITIIGVVLGKNIRKILNKNNLTS